jgi:hypothetical protein
MEKRMDEYALSKLLKQFSEALGRMPGQILREISETSEDGLRTVEKAIVENMKKVAEFQHIFDTQVQEIVDVADEGWNKIRDSRKELDAKIKRLGEDYPLKLPTVYHMKELLDIADRCNRLTDEQWKRVVELAKAMREKNEV